MDPTLHPDRQRELKATVYHEAGHAAELLRVGAISGDEGRRHLVG